MKGKKILSLMLTAAISIGTLLSCSAFSAFAKPIKFGDADGDGEIATADVLVINQKVAGMSVNIKKDNADVNVDDVIDTVDALILTQYLANMNVTLGPSEPKKYIALTFDDGPNTYGGTEKCLKALEYYGVPATFFLIGQNINDNSAKMVERALKDGCEIGNHSYGYESLNTMTPEQIQESIKKTDDEIYNRFGIKTKYFRAPNLAMSDTMVENIQQTFIQGLVTNDWNKAKDRDVITEEILTQAHDGMIILLHDSEDSNERVIRKVVRELTRKNYEFVTLSKLFEIKGVTPDHNTVYSEVVSAS